MKKKRQLFDMNIKEMSLVDKGANRKKFLLIKREDEITELLIKTDGTVDGTTLSVNDEEVKDLKSFWFSLWPDDEFSEGMMSGTYTIEEADGAEFDRESTFHLKKGMKTMKLKELLRLLKVDPETVDQESADRLGTLLKFVDMMPPADATFALNLIKAALMKEAAPAEEVVTEDTPAETDGMSPEKVAEIRSAMAQLNGMLPEDQQVVIKAEEPSELAQILEAIKGLSKSDGEEPDDNSDDPPSTVQEILQAIIKMDKRMAKVEKTTGVSEEVPEDGPDDPLELYAKLTKEEKIAKHGTAYGKTQVAMGFDLREFMTGQ